MASKEGEALVQLAQRIMSQRGERWRQRTLTAYCAALKQRMGEICDNQQREITGAELFRTIPRASAVAWEDVPEEEQSLYTAVAQNFNNESEAEKQGV